MFRSYQGHDLLLHMLHRILPALHSMQPCACGRILGICDVDIAVVQSEAVALNDQVELEL